MPRRPIVYVPLPFKRLRVSRRTTGDRVESRAVVLPRLTALLPSPGVGFRDTLAPFFDHRLQPRGTMSRRVDR